VEFIWETVSSALVILVALELVSILTTVIVQVLMALSTLTPVIAPKQNLRLIIVVSFSPKTALLIVENLSLQILLHMAGPLAATGIA
jgi:hypothetical protein